MTEERGEVEGIRRVLRAASELPEGIPPDRDLWPGVEARIRAEGGTRLHGPDDLHGRDEQEDPDLRRAAPWLAAAAAVLVAASVGATLWLSGGGETQGIADSRRPGIEAAGPTVTVPASVGGVRSAYAPLVSRLGELVERRRDRLPPVARRVLERNLGIIDEAIAQAEAALSESPASPELIRALDHTYERKLELLRRSARLAARL